MKTITKFEAKELGKIGYERYGYERFYNDANFASYLANNTPKLGSENNIRELLITAYQQGINEAKVNNTKNITTMKRENLSMIMTEAHRFIKISGVKLSEALKRAWANFKLTVRMRAEIVKFYYRKVDGSIREAYGTLSSRLIPVIAGTDSRKKNDTTQTYFDTEKQEWRCFKKLNLVY